VAFRIFGREFGAPGPEARPWLTPLLLEAAAHQRVYAIKRIDELKAAGPLLAAEPAEQVGIVLAALEALKGLGRSWTMKYAEATVLAKLVSDLLRRALPFTEADLARVAHLATDLAQPHGMLPMGSVLKTVESFAERSGLGETLRPEVERLSRAWGPNPTRQDDRKMRDRVLAVLGEGVSGLKLTGGEPWGDAVTASLAELGAGDRDAWQRVLLHAQSGGAATPSAKWLKKAKALVDAIGVERVAEQAVEWLVHVTPSRDAPRAPQTLEALEAIGREMAREVLEGLSDKAKAAAQALLQMIRQPPANPDETWMQRYQQLLATAGPTTVSRLADFTRSLYSPGPLLPEPNGDALRGLVWACSLLPAERRLVVTIGDLAQRCLKKIPNHGAFSSKVGHACIWTLGSMSGIEPVAQLGRLKQRVKYPVSLRLVDKALAAAARRASITPEELEEMAVPAYGLTEPGLGRTTVGDYTATVTVTGSDDVELSWTGASGRAQKTVPKAVQEEHAAELKELKRGVKDITSMLPAQRDRIERLFLAPDRHWRLADWRVRYFDHPLLSVVARRLIWRFQDGDDVLLGVGHEGRIVDVEGAPLPVSEAAQVRLWHPLGSPAEEVLAWRDRLRELEIRQPFKQAHREIYVLTDAEVRTETYSNRFAAHIIRQHQFAALCRERGWRYHLQGAWDSHNTPTLVLPQWGLGVEFWVEPLDVDAEAQSESGIYMHLATDQVRFNGPDGSRRLEELSPLLFSEVMRDVDLFVGVTSIGADPTWADRGDEAMRGYWRDYAFGELGTSAATRREVLATLLPKLKIAPVCTLEGRFLRVQGRLRTYKIHVGSGNILMEPNDKYLCIVPDRSTASRSARDLKLPFEGDQTLAVIVSKAILLAADDRITDDTIVRQIRRQ
jgi:Domain of unknown function (DUF4132)